MGGQRLGAGLGLPAMRVCVCLCVRRRVGTDVTLHYPDPVSVLIASSFDGIVYSGKTAGNFVPLLKGAGSSNICATLFAVTPSAASAPLKKISNSNLI